MRGKVILLVGVLLFVSPKAQAFVVINEVHADPAGDLSGDANNDGIRSSSSDEFIEILNLSDQAFNISGWQLTDSVTTRHIFPPNTFIQPHQYLVIFGGGSPQLPSIHWQTATSGSLGLNNSGDTVTLLDLNSQTIDQITYASLANNNQSIVRFPEGEGTFTLHSQIPQANGTLYSPGTDVTGRPLTNTVIPEAPTLIYLLSAGLATLRRFKCK